MAQKFIPLNAITKLMKSGGAYRSSLKAKLELKNFLEFEILRVAESSIELSKHANRNTVLDNDVKLVITQEMNH